MLIVVIYDIQCSTAAGRRRLYQVAKHCEARGKRVQESVFECLLDAAQFRDFYDSLSGMIDPENDSLRFYNLGNSYENRIIRQGAVTPEYYENPLIL